MARKKAASCSLGGAVYVFCGEDSSSDALNSIEVLRDACSSPQLLSEWSLISMPETILSARYMPAAAPISDSEIAIIGGLSESQDEDELNALGDVILFDTNRQEASKVVKNYAGLIQIYAPLN